MAAIAALGVRNLQEQVVEVAASCCSRTRRRRAAKKRGFALTPIEAGERGNLVLKDRRLHGRAAEPERESQDQPFSLQLVSDATFLQVSGHDAREPDRSRYIIDAKAVKKKNQKDY